MIYIYHQNLEQTFYLLHFLSFSFKSSLEDVYIDFRGRGREREREREMLKWERNIDQLPPISALNFDQTCSPGMCPDQGSDQQPISVQDTAPSNWVTWSGLSFTFSIVISGDDKVNFRKIYITFLPLVTLVEASFVWRQY